MSEKKKLFVLTFPVISHLNAIVNVINDLVQMHNYKQKLDRFSEARFWTLCSALLYYTIINNCIH